MARRGRIVEVMIIEVGVDCGVLNLGETNAKAVDPYPEQCRIF